MAHKGSPYPRQPSGAYPTQQQAPPPGQYPGAPVLAAGYQRSPYPGQVYHPYPGGGRPAYPGQPYPAAPYPGQAQPGPYPSEPPPPYSQQGAVYPPPGPGPAPGPGYQPRPGYNHPPPQQYQYRQPQPGTVVVQGGFDAGARFDGNRPVNIPPPPPGCAPNAAQMASVQGQNVVVTQRPDDWFTGGSDGGYTIW